jgi:hypothetical protein
MGERESHLGRCEIPAVRRHHVTSRMPDLNPANPSNLTGRNSRPSRAARVGDGLTRHQLLMRNLYVI